MPQDPSQWLRGHMREHLARPADAPAKVVTFDRPAPGAPRTRGTAALELVQRAAEAISDIEERANDTEERAKSLVRGAIEKLNAAEARIEAAESARREAIDETAARLAEAVEALKRAEARVAAAEAATLAARNALQTHGAIGFTSEHDLSLWLLRVQALRSAWGDPAAHRRRVLEAL
jgi:alkylation response protein AidB-like acyl-CoA dehydrogenase